MAHRAFALQVQLEALPQLPASLSGTGLRVIRSGRVTGPLLSGSVQSGHVRWQADAAREAVDLQLQVVVLRDDGTIVEVRDRSVHAVGAAHGEIVRLASATSLHVAEAEDGLPVLFVGQLDASRLMAGTLTLTAFRVA